MAKLLIEYKFWYIKRDDFGNITEAAIRFYEGKIQIVLGLDSKTHKSIAVRKYVRLKRLHPDKLTHLNNTKQISDSAGNPAVIYTQKDFGIIKTDDELRVFLNKQLQKDPNHIAIKEQ